MAGGDVCPVGRGSLVSFDAIVLAFFGWAPWGRCWDIYRDIFLGKLRESWNEKDRIEILWCVIAAFCFFLFFLSLAPTAGGGEEFLLLTDNARLTSPILLLPIY